MLEVFSLFFVTILLSVKFDESIIIFGVGESGGIILLLILLLLVVSTVVVSLLLVLFVRVS
jgi:hypothetical protein